MKIMHRQSNILIKKADRALGLIIQIFVLINWIYDKIRNLFKKTVPVIKKIFIIKICCFGDAVLTLPCMRALKKKYPESEITVLTSLRAVRVFQNHVFIESWWKGRKSKH